MTDRSKFEQMLEHLINEESDKAKELFHQLVVEKSREIYENILEDDFADEEEKTDEATDDDDEKVEEAADDEEDQQDESFEGSDDENDDMSENFGFSEGDDEIGGDASDDMIDDIDAEMGDDEGDDMGGEGDLEDRVVDLEDALDDLRAEFEQLMADEGGEEEHGDMDMGDDEGNDLEFEDSFVREYVEKVGNPKHGDDGANAKSIVAGKNDMGGTTANITKGGDGGKGGTQGGLLNPSPKDLNSGNINVPGGNAGKTAFKKKEPGHGAEKKATGDNGDRSADSPLNGAPKRAK